MSSSGNYRVRIGSTFLVLSAHTDGLIDLYGIDLPPVSSIPGLKATRKKGYDVYYAYLFLSTAGEVDFKRIAKIRQLPTSSDQDWLETIGSSVAFVLETFLSLIGSGRFSANPAWSKLKFEIYGGRLLGSDKAIGGIVTTIKDILEGCGGDGGK
jgi:hypothetical protein